MNPLNIIQQQLGFSVCIWLHLLGVHFNSSDTGAMARPLGVSVVALGVSLASLLFSTPGSFSFTLTLRLTPKRSGDTPLSRNGSPRTVRWTTVPAHGAEAPGSSRLRSRPSPERRGVSSRIYLSAEAPVATSAEGEKKVDPFVTELPDSFEDSIARMGKYTLQAMDEGQKLLRIDFDTSAGDETYTTLKASLEMAKQLTKMLAEALIGDKEGATLALFFPDAGSAALAKFDWGAGTDAAQVPAGVRFCTVKTEEPFDTDVGCILLCPRNSEADFALELLKKVQEKGQFMVLVNPALINMGTTGYGLAGRRIRDEIISAFHTTYYLRTLLWGAVTREYGKRYTVWQNDADDPSGYRLLKAVSERPVGEALDDIYDVANGLADEDSSPDFLDSVAKFVRDFGRL